MTELNNTTETTETAPVLTLKTQKELFSELDALTYVADLAQQAVENKMREMAEELGSTFKSEGLCAQHPDAALLQIRVRMNKKVGRPVPFFVPLNAHPRTWLGKEARDAAKRVSTGISDLDNVMSGGIPAGKVSDVLAHGTALMKIAEPNATTAVMSVDGVVDPNANILE